MSNSAGLSVLRWVRGDLSADKALAGLYLKADEETGYVRDENVLRDGITIEDAMSVLVRYRTGAVLTYSLNAFSPAEGSRVVITGDAGRLEYEEHHSSRIISGGKEEAAGGRSIRLFVQKHFSRRQEIPIEVAEGAWSRRAGAAPLRGGQVAQAGLNHRCLRTAPRPGG